MNINKNELRKHYLAIRDKIPQELLAQYSQKATNIILTHSAFVEAASVFLYLTYGSELNTASLIKKSLDLKKQVLIPVVRKKTMHLVEINHTTEFQKGTFGILEPIFKEYAINCAPDFTLVPGLVYNKAGFRIGYGGGYYDRFLAKYKGYSLGIALPGFVDEQLAPQPFDIPVNELIAL